jgi:hypothetical protein
MSRDADARASLLGSQVVGLAMTRYIVAVDPLASNEHTLISALRDMGGAAARVTAVGSPSLCGSRRPATGGLRATSAARKSRG